MPVVELHIPWTIDEKRRLRRFDKAQKTESCFSEVYPLSTDFTLPPHIETTLRMSVGLLTEKALHPESPIVVNYSSERPFIQEGIIYRNTNDTVNLELIEQIHTTPTEQELSALIHSQETQKPLSVFLTQILIGEHNPEDAGKEGDIRVIAGIVFKDIHAREGVGSVALEELTLQEQDLATEVYRHGLLPLTSELMPIEVPPTETYEKASAIEKMEQFFLQ